jgi:hypothetical protein
MKHKLIRIALVFYARRATTRIAPGVRFLMQERIVMRVKYQD